MKARLEIILEITVMRPMNFSKRSFEQEKEIISFKKEDRKKEDRKVEDRKREVRKKESSVCV